MDAYEVTKFREEKEEGKFNYCFGMDSHELANRLRELADAIDDKLIVPQSCRIITESKLEDFTMTFLRMVFSEKRMKHKDGTVVTKKELVKLYHPDYKFPVAHARAVDPE